MLSSMCGTTISVRNLAVISFYDRFRLSRILGAARILAESNDAQNLAEYSTFDGVLPATGRTRLLAPCALTDGLFDERTSARLTTILRTDDDCATSLLDASSTTHVAVRPVAPVAENTVHRSCNTCKCYTYKFDNEIKRVSLDLGAQSTVWWGDFDFAALYLGNGARQRLG